MSGSCQSEGRSKETALRKFDDPRSAPREGRALFPSETPILSIHNVTKTFGGVHALNGVSFSLMRGSITAVIGPNGSGKTTLVNCITGIYQADAGTIVLGGNNIVGVSPNEIASRGWRGHSRICASSRT